MVSRSSWVSIFSRKLTSRAWWTARPRASELFFRSGNCSPYLNHQRAGQSKKQRTWLGERTEAIAVSATWDWEGLGIAVNATSGATSNSMHVLSGGGASIGKA